MKLKDHKRKVANLNSKIVLQQMELDRLRLARDCACGCAMQFGSIDGEHHKAWVIDQMVRALMGAEYSAWVAEHNEGEDGPDTYAWDCGITP